MHYNELTRHHFETASAFGTIENSGRRRGEAGAVDGGTWVRFDVLSVEILGAQQLRDVKFSAYGCPHVIAVADWLARESIGMTAVPALPYSVVSIRERFAVPVEKMGRLLIIEDAWIAAMQTPSR